MFNQSIFNSQFVRLDAADIQKGRPDGRWESFNPGFLVLMIPCDSGARYLEDLLKRPQNPALLAYVHNDFLDPDGPYSVISLIFRGTLRNIAGRWNVEINLGSTKFSFKIPPNADTGIVLSHSVELAEVTDYVGSYVRTHRHSMVTGALIPV
ncbi:MAG: hypothetical protein NVSMB39_3370 [Candidatus Saccharimonadales bacterium]